MGWQIDDATTELLLTHSSLDAVLRFVVARDDVRAMAEEPGAAASSHDTDLTPKASTIPAGPRKAA